MPVSPPTSVQLGIAIRRAREERRMTIEGLAERAGISWRYLSYIELGKDEDAEKNNPTWTVLGGIAEALGLEVSELARLAEEVAAGR